MLSQVPGIDVEAAERAAKAAAEEETDSDSQSLISSELDEATPPFVGAFNGMRMDSDTTVAPPAAGAAADAI